MKNSLVKIQNLEIEILKGNTRKNSKKLNELLSDDFIEFGGAGIEYNKQQIIEALLDEQSIEWDYEKLKSRNISDDVVIVNYIAIKKENDTEIKSLRASIWKNNNDKYQMIFHQGTNI